VNRDERNRLLLAAERRDPYAIRDCLEVLGTYDIARLRRNIALIDRMAEREVEWREDVNSLVWNVRQGRQT